MIDTLLTIDGQILIWIQEHLRQAWLTPVMTGVTKLGGLGLIWIVICLLLLCFKKTRWAGAAGLLGLIFSLLLNNLCLKRLVARTRPYEVVEGLKLLTAKATDFSFPSGHAGSSFAAATAICCMQKGQQMALADPGACHPDGIYEAVHWNSLSDGCAGGRTDRRTVRRGSLSGDEALPDGLDGA